MSTYQGMLSAVAPLPAVPAVLRCALSGVIGTGYVFLTRFYVGYSGTAPTNAELTTWNGVVGTAYGTYLKALVDTNNELTQIETTDLSSATAAAATTAEAITGTRSGTDATADMCVVTSYRIARRYRGGHPRGYWPMGTMTDVAGPGTWSGSFITSVNSNMANFMNAICTAPWSGGGTLGQENVSYYEGFTATPYPPSGRYKNVAKLRAGGPLTDPITSIVAQTSIGSQRRRTRFQD